MRPHQQAIYIKKNFKYSHSGFSSSMANFFGKKQDPKLANEKFDEYKRFMSELDTLIAKDQALTESELQHSINQCINKIYSIRCNYPESIKHEILNPNIDQFKSFSPTATTSYYEASKAKCRFDENYGSKMYRVEIRSHKPGSFESKLIEVLRKISFNYDDVKLSETTRLSTESNEKKYITVGKHTIDNQNPNASNSNFWLLFLIDETALDNKHHNDNPNHGHHHANEFFSQSYEHQHTAHHHTGFDVSSIMGMGIGHHHHH